MAKKTGLGPTATPGRRRTFTAKTEAVGLGVITDPTIESLTATRTMTSLTANRTMTSLTPKRVIEAI